MPKMHKKKSGFEDKKGKDFDFDGPTNLGGANLWFSSSKTGDGGSKFASGSQKPPKKGKKLSS